MILNTVECDTGLTQPHVFFSDTHMLDGSRAEDFQEKAFLSFLASVPREVQLVGLGDVLDESQGDIWHILHRHQDVLYELHTRRGAVILAGNHDWKLGACAGLPECAQIGNLYCDHGHRADPHNRTPYKAGWWLSVLCGLAERVGWQIDDEWSGLEGEARRMSKLSGRTSPDDPYFRRGRRILDRTGCTAYVFGHTHHALLETWGNLVIANCGHWIGPEGCTAIIAYPDRLELVRGHV